MCLIKVISRDAPIDQPGSVTGRLVSPLASGASKDVTATCTLTAVCKPFVSRENDSNFNSD